MPSLRLDGVEGKLGRAEHHQRTLSTVLSPHRAERGPFARVEPGHAHVLLATPDLPTTPEPDGRELGLIVGDFLSNARSALDHLAHEIGATFRVRIEGFPLRDKPEDFPGKAKFGWTKVPGAVREAVARLQPFAQSSPAAHPLRMLNRLRNFDTHEGLHVLPRLRATVAYETDPETGQRLAAYWRGLLNLGDTLSISAERRPIELFQVMDFFLDLTSEYPFIERFDVDASKPFGYRRLDDEMASLIEREPVLSLLAGQLTYIRAVVVPEVIRAVEGCE